MRGLITAAFITLLAVPAFAVGAPMTEDEKTIYAIGIALARQLAVFNLTPGEFELVQRGFADSRPDKQPAVDYDSHVEKIQELAQTRRAALGAKVASEGKEFLAKVAAVKGAVKTESGLVYLSLKEGSGATPSETDTVKVHYRGTFTDGQEFDSSYKRDEPSMFPLNGLIKCWTEGVRKMKVGGKAKLVCPPAIAYGEKGAGSVIPPNATLIYEVELIDVRK
ncbi:MAG TPA: FKBP-type peptidyl-prolyl cis-trans isomerase [Geobacteraceae bacterium]|nr:FKBP-type peptidyl-prolyl cis-trans isomerase [Geobacteraceae bacterium]